MLSHVGENGVLIKWNVRSDDNSQLFFLLYISTNISTKVFCVYKKLREEKSSIDSRTTRRKFDNTLSSLKRIKFPSWLWAMVKKAKPSMPLAKWFFPGHGIWLRSANWQSELTETIIISWIMQKWRTLNSINYNSTSPVTFISVRSCLTTSSIN